MSEDPWGGLVVIDDLRRRRAARPRAVGRTMIIDTGLGPNETDDVLTMSSGYIDVWKLSFGTSVFVPRAVLRRKLAMIREHGIITCPGGTLFEAAILQAHCRDYMAHARSLGFTAVEISDGTITLPPFRRQRVIDCARKAGLTVLTEVGKKNPAEQLSAATLAEQALQDLAWGAESVIIEGRESGLAVGVYDDTGHPSDEAVETVARIMHDQLEKLIWEAPLKSQQAALIARFGLNVGLGNIDPRQVLALEALRVGLRFESLKPIADAMHASGKWDPTAIEDPATAHARISPERAQPEHVMLDAAMTAVPVPHGTA